ncbi:MAG: rod shape-determining protein MreD [Candidatus Promineifilaceae bacterium]|nr:rod shape-determining protein MreD [Candidatus Promineifilaceae bacterium]
MKSSVYLAVPLMIGLLILQASVLPHFPVLGVVPQLTLLATLAWSLLHELDQGLQWAVVAGLTADLFSATPLGVSALALMMAVVVIHLIQRNFPDSRVIMPLALSAVGTVVFWFVYLFLIRLLVPFVVGRMAFLGVDALADGVRAPGLMTDIASAYGLNGATLELIALFVAVHALLILPIYWGFYTLERVIRPPQVEL